MTEFFDRALLATILCDPSKLQRKLRAKRFKEAFHEDLAKFIADHPSLSYGDYWDADRRPYEKQWPEYRAAVKRAKAIRAERDEFVSTGLSAREALMKATG